MLLKLFLDQSEGCVYFSVSSGWKEDLMDYSAVAPPQQSGSADPNSAFADALARARQVCKVSENMQDHFEVHKSTMFI